ncbi:MAG: Rpn family recombination-promoting nuclease/putative transposase [Snowella sp.]
MYDNTCKFIAANFSQDLTTWLLGKAIELTVLEPTELFVEPIRADSLIFLQSEALIVHLEFQTDPKADIPFRMADYYLRIAKCFPGKEIYQVVIYLRKTNSPLVQQTTFELPQMQHRFNVIRLWEVPPEQLLESPGLLPFAVLSQTENPAMVLQRVVRKIEEIEDESKQNNVAASTAVIAGLILDKMIVERLLRKEIMRESVIYQAILAEGKAEGEAKGELQLVLKQLNRRFGDISQSLSDKIRELPVAEIERLGESLLDFQSPSDLVNWLDSY